MKRAMLVTILAMALSLSVLQVAFAHAKIDHCTPATGSTVAQAPGQVVCVMTEEIDTKLSTMSVWDASGHQVDKKDAHVDLNDPDHKTLLVSLDPAATNNGIYTVKYHTVTPDDGGITDGTFQFIVGSAAAAPAPVTAVESGGAAPDVSATPAALPQTGGSQANIGLIVSLLGLAVVGGGLAIRRSTH
jgi:LPXTG-motif cell wall-anchored protein